MDFLARQNRVNAGELPADDPDNIVVRDKVVVVIGGGDTGSDCVGTANRLGARQVHQFEILPKPPEARPGDTPWPTWPRILRTSTSHEEGCDRRWSVTTKCFSGAAQHVESLTGCQVEWLQGPSGWQMRELPGTEFTIKVDVVLLAMGFIHVVHGGLVDALGLALDGRGNVAAGPDGAASREGIFAAGDAASGASLVVRAIRAGRLAAEGIDRWLRR
jgi:glutamate synthase (NADPH/NADH) small chain